MKKKENDKEEAFYVVQTHELPRLILRTQRQVNDFTIDTTHLEASGHTIEDAADGLGLLIQKTKELRGNE